MRRGRVDDIVEPEYETKVIPSNVEGYRRLDPVQ